MALPIWKSDSFLQSNHNGNRKLKEQPYKSPLSVIVNLYMNAGCFDVNDKTLPLNP